MSQKFESKLVLLNSANMMCLNEKAMKWADKGPNYIYEDYQPVAGVKRVASKIKPFRECNQFAMPNFNNAQQYMKNHPGKFFPISQLKYSAKILFKDIKIKMNGNKLAGHNEHWYRYSLRPAEPSSVDIFEKRENNGRGDVRSKRIVTDIIPCTVHIDVFPRIRFESMTLMYCLTCHTKRGNATIRHVHATKTHWSKLLTRKWNLNCTKVNIHTYDKTVTVDLEGTFVNDIFSPNLKLMTDNLRNFLIPHKYKKCYSWCLVFCFKHKPPPIPASGPTFSLIGGYPLIVRKLHYTEITKDSHHISPTNNILMDILRRQRIFLI